MNGKQIDVYDTTLRDGTQAEDINLTNEDKLKIARKLDDLGVKYIEGGWPGSNPTDRTFFREIQNYSFNHARISAFGATHHPNQSPEKDPNLQALLAAQTEVATIFGKTWEIHVQTALRTTLERNLELIHNTLAYLRPHYSEVIFDAEHFFDGYKASPEYALACLNKAQEAGANVLVLCDTNGGSLPHEISEIFAKVRKKFPDLVLGIHAHNDSELAVANTLAAVHQGALHIQGTINGFGERCGNANLCSIIPNLEVKLGYQCLPEGNLRLLTMTANYISEVSNVLLFNRQPFVGRSAFAHKGGIHVSAVNRKSSLYEHMEPDLVGNKQRILLSELAGRSNIVSMAKRFGFHLDKDEPVVKGILSELKEKASMGYDFTTAEASVELLLFRKLARRGVREFFHLHKYSVVDTKTDRNGEPLTEATVMLEVEGEKEHTAATGRGPVNALDNALRKALISFYPRLTEMRLLDFKVRVLTATDLADGGTASNVRVLIESGDSKHRWITVGVSYNVIEASWQALVDSITYKLYKDEQIHRQSSGED